MKLFKQLEQQQWVELAKNCPAQFADDTRNHWPKTCYLLRDWLTKRDCCIENCVIWYWREK